MLGGSLASLAPLEGARPPLDAARDEVFCRRPATERGRAYPHAVAPPRAHPQSNDQFTKGLRNREQELHLRSRLGFGWRVSCPRQTVSRGLRLESLRGTQCRSNLAVAAAEPPDRHAGHWPARDDCVESI